MKKLLHATVAGIALFTMIVTPTSRALVHHVKNVVGHTR